MKKRATLLTNPYTQCHQLPSYRSALSFMDEPNLENGLAVLGSWAGRSLIAVAGFFLCGEKASTSLKNGFIAASAIEEFVLTHAFISKRSERQ